MCNEELESYGSFRCQGKLSDEVPSHQPVASPQNFGTDMATLYQCRHALAITTSTASESPQDDQAVTEVQRTSS
jgi:hypothetical protein